MASPAAALTPTAEMMVNVFQGHRGACQRKRADFFVLNANPLENIRNTREIDSVYLNGATLDRAALQAKFKQAVVDRDATQAKFRKDYVPHPPS